MNKVVLVTGASGYIASHIIQELLAQEYKVRGTVRSLRNEEKIVPLRKLDHNQNLELVEADLLDDECWLETVDGCDYVIHTASPFPRTNPTTEDDVIVPAVKGTLRVLRACATAKIKRVVMTSSSVAIGSGKSKPAHGDSYTEEDWADPEKAASAYEKSKILAEQAAWDFVQNLPGEQKFELVVIAPPLVIGPLLMNNIGTSVVWIKQILTKETPLLPRLCLGVVDVRDVAKAHVVAMTNADAAGNRHITSAQSLWFADIAKVIERAFEPMGYKIPTLEAPYWLLWLLGRFDKDVRMILPYVGYEYQFDNSRFLKTLGISPQSVNESILETCYSLIEAGHVKKTNQYRPRE